MTTRQQLYLEPIDGLRFLAALWVVFSHISIPIYSEWSKLKSIATLATNGAWAVIIFFVISGLCIHLPYAQGKKMNPRSFYLARFSRIGIPMAVAILISLLSEDGFGSLDGILWSLYCEIAYYVMYPLLLRIFPKFNISKCITVSTLASALLLTFPDKHLGLFWSYGFLGTTLLGLPIWLTGCLLAEAIVTPKKSSILENKNFLQLLRASIFLLGMITMALEFHSPLKYKYTFLICTPIIYYWLYSELIQKQLGKILTQLKPLGAASYSLYLTHKLPLPLFAYLGMAPEQNLAHWSIYITLTFAFCTLYFFSIEKPAHLLSKKLSKARI